MSVLRNGYVACICRFKFLLSSVNSKNGHVPCHLFFGPHVSITKVHVALSNLRDSHVTLSILGVKGHYDNTLLYIPTSGRWGGGRVPVNVLCGGE